MSKLTLSKSALLKEAKQLDTYERFLPSLDLKRKQLLIEQNEEERRQKDLLKQMSELIQDSANELQMLGNKEMQLDNLIVIKNVEIENENRLGVMLPKLKAILIDHQPYGLLTKPHWVDLLTLRLKEACVLEAKLHIQNQRVDIMQHATRKATQRVNLVSRILIPEARKNIRRIKIFLSDNERAAVVRSKIAKKKKQAQELVL